MDSSTGYSRLRRCVNYSTSRLPSPVPDRPSTCLYLIWRKTVNSLTPFCRQGDGCRASGAMQLSCRTTSVEHVATPFRSGTVGSGNCSLTEFLPPTYLTNLCWLHLWPIQHPCNGHGSMRAQDWSDGLCAGGINFMTIVKFLSEWVSEYISHSTLDTQSVIQRRAKRAIQIIFPAICQLRREWIGTFACLIHWILCNVDSLIGFMWEHKHKRTDLA